MPNAKSIPATNRILQTLSPQEGARLLARHQQVPLTYGAVLCEYGKPLRHVYFINSGIVSLLIPVAGHPSVEVGLVGREGMAGMGVFLGLSFLRCGCWCKALERRCALRPRLFTPSSGAILCYNWN